MVMGSEGLKVVLDVDPRRISNWAWAVIKEEKEVAKIKFP